MLKLNVFCLAISIILYILLFPLTIDVVNPGDFYRSVIVTEFTLINLFIIVLIMLVYYVSYCVYIIIVYCVYIIIGHYFIRHEKLVKQ